MQAAQKVESTELIKFDAPEIETIARAESIEAVVKESLITQSAG